MVEKQKIVTSTLQSAVGIVVKGDKHFTKIGETNDNFKQ